MAVAISTSKDLDSAFSIAVHKICEDTDWVFGQVWIPSEDGTCMVCNSAWYTINEKFNSFRLLSKNFSFSKGDGFIGKAWLAGRPIWLENYSEQWSFSRAACASELGLLAALAIPIVIPDKTIAILEFFMTESRHEDKESVGLISAITNQLALLFERKSAEEQYRKINEYFTGIFNCSKDAICFSNQDGVLLNINDAFVKLTGYTREELINEKRYQDITPPKYHEEQKKIVSQVLKTGIAHEFEKEYIRKDGAYTPVLVTNFIVRDRYGKPVGLAGVVRDISEQKQKEEQLKKTNELLEQKVEERTQGLSLLNRKLRNKISERDQIEKILKGSEEKYRNLIEYSPDAIGSSNLDGIITSWNPAAEALFGYKAEELLGKHILLVYPEEKYSERETIINIIKSGQSIQNYETVRIRKDGRKIQVSLSISPIKNIHGKVVAVTAVIRDITKQKEQEKLISEANRKLETLISNLPGIVYRCVNDKDWTMEYISSGCKQLCEFDADELIDNKTKTFNSIIHKDDRKMVWDTIQKALKEKESYTIEYRIITKSGKEKWVFEKGCGVFYLGKPVILEGFIQDITKEKKLKQMLNDLKLKQEQEIELKTFEHFAQDETDLVEKLFRLPPLRTAVPGVFQEITNQFEQLIIATTETTKTDISKELSTMGKELTALKATPGDVMEIYSRLIRNLSLQYTPEEVQHYTEKARIILIELLSSLVKFYRKRSLVAK